MRWLVATAGCAAVLAGAAGAAPTADECRGLQSCISVPGPWVAVPASRAAGSWILACPEGVVAGLDARVSERPLDVSFDGFLGSPVNPGITTERQVLFTGRWVGTERKTVSFKPYVGCIRGGGGRRTPTGLAQVPPGRPVVVRATELRLLPGRTARGSLRCNQGERLLVASHAVGVYGERPPRSSLLDGVRVTRTLKEGVVVASATRPDRAASTRAVVQLQVVCTR